MSETGDYFLEVRRGREQLCGECRESLLLKQARKTRWVRLSLGLKEGFDYIGLAQGEKCDEAAKDAVRSVALWTQLAVTSHDHVEWNLHKLKQAKLKLDEARAEVTRREVELMSIVDELLRETGVSK